jgi:hypothetical protein
VKYGIRDLQVMLLSIHEVHENWHGEYCTFCMGVLKLHLCMYYKTVLILKVRTVLVGAVYFIMEYITCNFVISFINIHIWYYKDWFYHDMVLLAVMLCTSVMGACLP